MANFLSCQVKEIRLTMNCKDIQKHIKIVPVYSFRPLLKPIQALLLLLISDGVYMPVKIS